MEAIVISIVFVCIVYRTYLFSTFALTIALPLVSH